MMNIEDQENNSSGGVLRIFYNIPNDQLRGN
jgi:hypothetical protein